MEASALHAPPGVSRLRGSAGATFLRLRSDEQLVELFRAGHDEAFRAIHDRYRTRLFAYTRQMLPQSRQDAEDALQDVFIRAYAGLRASDRHVALRAWLYRIAHNRCVDHLRKNTPIPTDELEATSRDVATDPIAATEQREALAKLVTDVQRLPEQQRSALLLRELSGMSYQELADSLDLTIPAIKSLLVRARGGLAAAAEARDTDCEQIRVEIIESHERGVRPNALVRRHLGDCAACRAYRESVRGISRSLAALIPGPVLLASKFIGAGAGAVSTAGGAAGTSATAASGGTTAGGALAGSVGAAGTGAVAAGGAAAGGAAAGGAAAGTALAGGAITGGAITGGMTATHLAALIAAAAAATAGGAVAVSVQGAHPRSAGAAHLPAAAIVAHAVSQGISAGSSAAAAGVAPVSVPAGTPLSVPAHTVRRGTASGARRPNARRTMPARTAAGTTTVRTATASLTTATATTRLTTTGARTTTGNAGTATTASGGSSPDRSTSGATTTAPITGSGTDSSGTTTGGTGTGSTTTARTDTASATTPDRTSTTSTSTTPSGTSSPSGASTTAGTTTSPTATTDSTGGGASGSTQ
ncbi:RNA polymerase sigma factor [Conexibacter sp. DBS9H8]|uniref:RNA polymerase sigma factor n=1 Tax=Conexibacter sp. DBS9H8 TaxID=2937801 RepID=UPI00200EF607|nr:sigma-70 family RNA polymerase sigma factor [Conexibacter sp. DBS9H8]